MKIRSVLLGSVAIAGLTTAGYAADLGVVTSLDVCDSLSISGLTISSDDNCLQISGNISFEYDYGNYNDRLNHGGLVFTPYAVHGTHQFTVPLGGTDKADSAVDLDWWLKFVATADSDFGPATATIKLANNNWGSGKNQTLNGSGPNTNYAHGTSTLAVKEAWVGVGDTTKLMAGYKGSIFNNGDDTPLNYLGLFNSQDVNTGVGFATGVHTGSMSIQVTSDLGNGLMIGGGLENLDTPLRALPSISAIGVMSYAGDGITAHVSTAFDQNSTWNVHAGFTGTFDKVKVVGAVAADQSPIGTNAGNLWWNVLGSASLNLDMFTLAGSFEATSGSAYSPGSEWGVGASATATVSDGVTLNIGGRYFTNTLSGAYVAQVEAGISAAVTEAITLTAAVGGVQDSLPATGNNVPSDFYGKAGVAWNPGGGFTAAVTGEVDSDGGYKATFKATKSIK